jgi:hypothetical protein
MDADITAQTPDANREYKNSVFTMLFDNKAVLIELTKHKDPADGITVAQGVNGKMTIGGGGDGKVRDWRRDGLRFVFNKRQSRRLMSNLVYIKFGFTDRMYYIAIKGGHHVR